MDREEIQDMYVKSIISSIACLCVCVGFFILVYVVNKMTIGCFILCLIGIMLNSAFLGYNIYQYVSFKRATTALITFEKAMKDIEERIKCEEESPFKEFNGEEEK